ncbi:uncharacterized protein LOC141598311 [Silene latifolia]|uniref:uncharacterized protein LOC141598311 n=1 Tax=Silene latifolia TaxID=37657 RepID=UPI003D7789FB
MADLSARLAKIKGEGSQGSGDAEPVIDLTEQYDTAKVTVVPVAPAETSSAAQKRKIEDVDIYAPAREVRARVDNMEAARVKIRDYAASKSDVMLTLDPVETATQAVASVDHSVSLLAGALAAVKEGAATCLHNAYQATSLVARIDLMRSDYDRLKSELDFARADLAAKATDLVRVQAERDAAKTEAVSSKRLLQEALDRNEELTQERDDLEFKLDDASLYFYIKGRALCYVELLRPGRSGTLKLRWLLLLQSIMTCIIWKMNRRSTLQGSRMLTLIRLRVRSRMLMLLLFLRRSSNLFFSVGILAYPGGCPWTNNILFSFPVLGQGDYPWPL